MNGDKTLTCILTFAHSSSPFYDEAVRLARAVPGYRRGDEGAQALHVIPFTIDTIPLAERLLRLVSGWRGAALCVDGITLYGGELLGLLAMLVCYRRHERSRLGEPYCWGLPEGGRGRVPCRLVESALPWTAPDHYADPKLRPSVVRALAAETFAALCPAFDAAAVETAIATWVEGERPRATFERLLDDVDLDLT